MGFEELIKYFPKAGFVKIAPPFPNEEELYDETIRKANKSPT